tara:strand:- start:85 stop:684 length:600 start_codon:yes stop_codon:yes gene_type:complete
MASELFVDNITGKTGTSGSAPITLSGNAATLGSGVTIGDSVVMTNKYYLHLNSGTAYGTFTNGQVYNSGTTRPYFANATGDTTNIATSGDQDYKIVRAGIYFVHFSATYYGSGTDDDRGVYARIRHNASSVTSDDGTDILASTGSQLADTNSSSSDYSSAQCAVVYNFSANHRINFWVYATENADLDRLDASIVLIRPL